MTYWPVPPLWAGQDCVILGCGPSRQAFPIDALQGTGTRVIAINDSFRVAPWADLLYFCDQKWWDSRQSEVRRVWQGGLLVTLENQIPGAWRLKNTGQTGFDSRCWCLRTGNNSGFQALHLCAHLGVRSIKLVGFDMRVVGDKMHAEDRPEQQQPADFDRVLRLEMLPLFEGLVRPLAERGIAVVNASPGSRLTCWPTTKKP